jgi:hypothetical protein
MNPEGMIAFRTRQAPSAGKPQWYSELAALRHTTPAALLWYGSAGIRITVVKLLLLRKCVIALVGVLLVSLAAHGARLENLFQTEVDAAGRDAVSRDAALKQALQDVLVRVTGSVAALSDPAAQQIIDRPGRLVEQFRFQETPATVAGEPAQLRLWAQFDGVSLARDIRRAGLPYWGQERPDVLLWLAVDDRGRRYVVSETAESEVTAALMQSAARRGLPLTLPLMDLQDQRAVQFTDVWGGFIAALQAGSERYRPQVILVGRVGHSGVSGGWRADWNLLGAGSNRSWGFHAATLNAAVSRGVAEATEWLASKYALVASGNTTLTLEVEGIRNLGDYARTYEYLVSLTPVEQVQVATATGEQVAFSLRLNAEERSLLQIITLGKVLETVEDPSAWRFRLTP